MNTTLKHAKCGGSFVLEFSNMYIVTAPSIILGVEGISAGVGEIKKADSGRVEARLHCLKCGENHSLRDTERVSCSCFACKNAKNVSKLYISEYRLIFCESCMNYVLGKTKEISETARKALQYFSPTEKNQFLPLSEILKKPVNF